MTDFAKIGAAVIGTGFIGTVHVQTLRRLGVQVRGVLGSSPERGADRAAEIGVAPCLCHARRPARRRQRRRGPRDLAQPRPLRSGEGDPRRRQERRLREAACHDLRPVRRDGGDREGERKGRRRLLQHPLLPAEPAGAWYGAGGGTWRYPLRHRPLPPGLAGQAHRLELAAAIRDGRRAALRRRHRHALGRPDWLCHRFEARGRDGRTRYLHPRTPKAHRPGRDVLQAAAGATESVRSTPTTPR
jgi:hypothetical protein